MNKLFRNLALGIVLLSQTQTIFAEEKSNKAENSSDTKSINQKFDGWSFRLSEAGHVSGFWTTKESQYPALANTFIYLDVAARYGKTIGDSDFWIGGEINPLNITWKYTHLAGRPVSNFLYYFPHASLVL